MVRYKEKTQYVVSFGQIQLGFLGKVNQGSPPEWHPCIPPILSNADCLEKKLQYCFTSIYIRTTTDWDALWTMQVVEKTIRPCLVELSEDPDVDVRFFATQALQSSDQVMMST